MFQYGLKMTDAHLFDEHRRLGTQRAADNHRRVERRRAIRRNRVPGPQPKHRDVDTDEPLVAKMRKPAQPLHRELDLPRARGERDPERCLRLFADDAIGDETVPGLESLDRQHSPRFVGASSDGTRTGRQIAHGGQQTTQRGETGYASPGRIAVVVGTGVSSDTSVASTR